jgi:hypothetical protein
MGFVDLVFGCSHKKLSFPITVRRAREATQAASLTGTYVVCLDCGREFPYDWKEMKVVRGSTSASPAGLAAEPRRA